MATGSVLASTAGYAYAGGAEAQGVATGSPGVASGNSVQVPITVPVNACGNTVDVIGLLNPSFGNRCANVSGGSHQAATPAQGGQSGGGSGATGGGHTGGGTGGVDGSSASGSQGTAVPGATVPGVNVPGAGASGVATNSPGVISGNSIQAPVDVPVNACGNSANVAGVGNPAFGNDCANVEKVAPVSTPKPAEECEQACPTPPQVAGEGGSVVVRNAGPATPAVAPAAAVATAAPAQAAQLASTGAGDVELLGAAGLAL
ncbi:chaplin, partial [Kitasatospora sp. NPDC004799]|uniref:chaplin n=1 Tax=Kitasatospora sp. NPDC004799 TaxID=3154460 RepID=UPI0033A3A9D1